LWASGGRAEARELAVAARAEYVAANLTADVAEIDAWLAKVGR